MFSNHRLVQVLGRINLVWLVFALTPLGGCTSGILARDTQPMQTYLLEAPAAAPANLVRGRPVVRVTDTRSAPGYASADMIYVVEPHRLDRFAHHRWADSPARMLASLLKTRLESSGLYSGVIGAESRAQEDLRLDTEILRLQQVFEGDHSEIQFDLHISLSSARTGRQLAGALLSEREPAEPNPYGGVEAANRALERLLVRIETLLRDAQG